MPREKEGFREQLARLDERFPDKETLGMAEVSAYLGTYRRTLISDKTFPARKLGKTKSEYGGVYIIPKVLLARWLC